MFYFDSTYILVIIGAVLSLGASLLVQTTYNKYSKVRSATGFTGAEAATRLLHYNGIYDVVVNHVAGSLTDHYDPKTKTLNLSDGVYQGTSVAAIGVAAHECGHAVQDAEGFAPLHIRGAMVPVARIGTSVSWPLIFIGYLMGNFGGGMGQTIMMAGAVLFSLAVLFQLVTLPVEINASTRAVACLDNAGIMGDEELSMVKKVLTAAAMTYLAALAAYVLQLLRLLVLANGGRRRRG
ncbi:MAG: zinc metallopeptidase [Lachnospiraceae bacterium]|jgi:Zn-dependent membrane protease YugP|nr:zinc metallopeptidase [Lachnospiraceae bacterium]